MGFKGLMYCNAGNHFGIENGFMWAAARREAPCQAMYGSPEGNGAIPIPGVFQTLNPEP